MLEDNMLDHVTLATAVARAARRDARRRNLEWEATV
jgi:hypothetical protein